MLSAEYGWTDDMILDLTPARVQLARQAISSRLVRSHEREARLLELTTRYLVSAAYGSTGGKGARAAARSAAKAVTFLPEKTRPKETKPIPYELAVRTFGEPLIPPREGVRDG